MVKSRRNHEEKNAPVFEYHVKHRIQVSREKKKRKLKIKFLDSEIKSATKNKKRARDFFRKFGKTVVTVKRTSSLQVKYVKLEHSGTTYKTKNFLDFDSENIPNHVQNLSKMLRESMIFLGQKVQVGGILEIQHRKTTSTGDSLSLSEVTPYRFFGVRTHNDNPKYIGHIQEIIPVGKKRSFKTVSKKLSCFNKKSRFFSCQKTKIYRSNPGYTLMIKRYTLKPEND